MDRVYACMSVEYSEALLRKSMFIVKKNSLLSAGRRIDGDISVMLGLGETKIDNRIITHVFYNN